MPHKCAHCKKIIEDGSPQLMTGCECGSKVFLYLRKDYAQGEEDAVKILEKQEVPEEDVEKIASRQIREGEIVTLDIENILQYGDGEFVLDLHSLMKGDPVVVKEKGVYYIDIQHAMQKREPGN